MPDVIANRHEFTSPTAPGQVFYVCAVCSTVSVEDRPCSYCFCHLCHSARRARSGLACSECQARVDSERGEREHAALLAREVVEDDGGPVYVPACDRYFESSHEAAEYVWDQEVDTTIAIPCDKIPAHTPDLLDEVTEAWTFDDEYGFYTPPAVVQQTLADVQQLIEKHAPTEWAPRKGVRLNLPPFSEAAEANA